MTRPASGSLGGLRCGAALLALVLATTPALAAPAPAPDASVDLRVKAVPIQIALELSKPTIAVSKSITAKATVTNVGQRKLALVTVALRVDVTGLVVAKGATGSITKLGAGKTGSVSWSVCGATAGAYLILARATVEGVNVDSAARLLVVTPGKGRC